MDGVLERGGDGEEEEVVVKSISLHPSSSGLLALFLDGFSWVPLQKSVITCKPLKNLSGHKCRNFSALYVISFTFVPNDVKLR